MNKLALAVAVAALCAPAFGYDSLEALIKDQAAKQVPLVRQYIADHPKADDLAMAERLLLQSLFTSEQKAEAAAMLEKKYATLLADKKNANLRDLIGGCLMPLLSAYLEDGQKDKVKATIERVEKDFADDANIVQIKKSLEQFRSQLSRPSTGDTLEIKFKALDGREVDLAAMKDKVVLVDFWATWCGPCIGELPNVKANYEKYHAKGFEIIGISLDDDKAKLEAFVKKENIPWAQSFSGEGWQDPIASKYGIKGIPAMFLIGKDGKVAAANARGPALASKLEELLK